MGSAGDVSQVALPGHGLPGHGVCHGVLQGFETVFGHQLGVELGSIPVTSSSGGGCGVPGGLLSGSGDADVGGGFRALWVPTDLVCADDAAASGDNLRV